MKCSHICVFITRRPPARISKVNVCGESNKFISETHLWNLNCSKVKIIAASIIGPGTSLIIIKLTIRLITYKHTISVYLLYLFISSTLVDLSMSPYQGNSDFELFGFQSWPCCWIWRAGLRGPRFLENVLGWTLYCGPPCGNLWWSWLRWLYELIELGIAHGCVIERKVVLIFFVQPIVLFSQGKETPQGPSSFISQTSPNLWCICRPEMVLNCWVNFLNRIIKSNLSKV